MDVSEQIMEYVSNAKRQASSAESRYDSRASYIEIRSSSSIDLFCGDAVSRVADIARLTREASDDLYSTYQTLVKLLDEQCRPLLEAGADTHSVKEATEFIKWLNEESKIETNFTGTLNGSSLGGLANVSYQPSYESLMIQKYWEMRYESMPGAAEETRLYNERKAEERRLRYEKERKEREALREFERSEQERIKREKAALERTRAESESILSDRLSGLRPVYKALDSLISCGNRFGTVITYITEDGTAKALGDNPKGQINVGSWKNIKQIVNDSKRTAGVSFDGRVYLTGDDSIYKLSSARGFSDVKKLAIGSDFIAGLRNDGRVYITGDYPSGHPNSTAKGPMYWTGIDDIFVSEGEVLGIKKDGSLIRVTYNSYGRSDTAGVSSSLTDILDADGGGRGFIVLKKDGKADVIGEARGYLDEINSVSGIVKVKMIGNRPAAIYHDGKIIIGRKDENDYGARKINNFISSEKLQGNIAAVSSSTGGSVILFLTRDGRLFLYQERWGNAHLSSGELKDVGAIFTDMYERADRIINYRKYREEAERKERELIEERQEKGLCRHCGGTFKKVFLGYKCESCGRRKDY